MAQDTANDTTETKVSGTEDDTTDDDLLERLKAGLGKDKPIKLWLDSDCACFVGNHPNKLMPGHPTDPDDGWALCAMLNSDRCRLVGVSSTYGNDAEDVTFKNLTEALSLHNKGKDVKGMKHRGDTVKMNPLTRFWKEKTHKTKTY